MTGPATGGPATEAVENDPRKWSAGEAYDKGYGAGRDVALRASRAAAEGDAGTLRAALRHIRGQITGRHPGYAGDHRIWTVQFNEASIARIDEALAAAPLPPAEPLDPERLARAMWEGQVQPDVLAAMTADGHSFDTIGPAMQALHIERATRTLARLATSTAATPAAGEPGE